MNLKTIEMIEKQDPSEETLKLTTRWRELTKPGDYCYTRGQWKRFNPQEQTKQNKRKSKSNYGKEKINFYVREWKG